MNKIIQRRDIPKGTPVCEDILLDRIYRSRHIQHSQELDHRLQSMHSPFLLKGMKSAVEILAISRDKKIIIVGDFDTDGATSTALMVTALRQLGFTNVHFLIPNRFEQGYGLSIPVG